MRVGFAGTPAFAASVLAAILDAGFAVPLVLTQPDRPRGRGLSSCRSPVKRLAMERGLVVAQPAALKTTPSERPLAVPIDVLVVAAYGLILPPAVLAWPRHGCLNVHASLLPRWRGAAPIQRALLAGDAETGITIMQMDAGLDTGPMLDVRIPIGPRETGGRSSASWRRGCAGAGWRAARSTRAARSRRRPSRRWAYLRGEDRQGRGRRRLAADAVAIDRQIRAFDPAPGA